ncbi:acyltransferase [Caulobacter sp.]|uniref:acyltransferase n=1 Tax=Caulobacter sp. TaxID=78 RepID=UPI003BA97240
MTHEVHEVFSPKMSKSRRLLRLVLGALDPRAYLHLIRIVNYYNHTHVVPRRKVRMGADCAIAPDVNFAHGERISLGSRVNIGPRCHIWAGPSTSEIRLADDVLLGPEVLITAATYDYNRGSPVNAQPMKERDIVIGRDVWIGCRAIVLAGVTIGDGCVIGAGSIVTKDLPPGSVAVGAPARVVHSRPGFA